MFSGAFKDNVWSRRVFVDVISVTNASSMILECSGSTLMSSCKSYFVFMNVTWFTSKLRKL